MNFYYKTSEKKSILKVGDRSAECIIKFIADYTIESRRVFIIRLLIQLNEAKLSTHFGEYALASLNELINIKQQLCGY